MATTRHINFADAVDPQDATPLHQVQAIATAAAVPATAGAVAATSHTAESALVSIAGTVSDLPLTANTVLGRGPTGDIVAVPFSTVAAGGAAITSLTGGGTASGPGAAAFTLADLPQGVLLTRTGALTADVPLNNHKLTGVASGGATTTNGANIGDVQAAAAALVPNTGHTAKSVLVSVAGTVSDQALTALTLMGADGAGNLGAIPYSSVVSGGGGGLTLTSSAPADVDKSAAVVGTGTTAARSDHKHNISTAAPVAGAVAAGNTVVEGTATSLARSDHQHAVAVAAPVDVGTSNAAGSATTLARSDHQHNVPFSAVSAALAAASSSISVNGQQITSVGAPTTAQAATNKAYVDGLLDGLRWKQPVLCASTTNVALSTGAQNGSVIDDITLTTGVRFALRVQTTASENGIYTANASGAPTRSTDADTGVELVSCAFFVQQGTVNADKAFTCTNDAITIGTTGIVFTQFASAPSGALLAVNNLSDLANAATARSNLGLAAIAASGSATDLISGTVNAARLPNTAVAPGTYGDASHVSTVTVDATGRLTAASQTAIAIAAASVSGLSTVQTGALTGDVAKLAGSGTTTLVNIPNDVPMVGALKATAIAAPGTPAPGLAEIYVDSASRALAIKNDAGIVSHTVQSLSASAHQFVTSINDDGHVGTGQPAVTDLAVVATLTTLANPTGGSAAPIAATVAQMRAMLGIKDTWDLSVSFGLGDGTGPDSILPNGTFFTSPFWVLPTTRNSDIPASAFPYGGSPTYTDANISHPAAVTEFPVCGTFISATLEIYCAAISITPSSGSPVFTLTMSKNGACDSSPISLSKSSVGSNTMGSIVSLGSFSVASGDRVGLRCTTNSVNNSDTVKFTATLRLFN